MKISILLSCLLGLVASAYAHEPSYCGGDTLHLSHNGSTILHHNTNKGGGFQLLSVPHQKLLASLKTSFNESVEFICAAPNNDAVLLKFRYPTPARKLVTYRIFTLRGNKFFDSATIASRNNDEIGAGTIYRDRCIIQWRSSIEMRDLSGHVLHRTPLTPTPDRTGGLLSPDGRWLAHTVNGRRVIFDTQTGKVLHYLEKVKRNGLKPHDDYIFDSFSDNGRYVMGRYFWFKDFGEYPQNEDPITDLGQAVWEIKSGKIVYTSSNLTCFWAGDLVREGHDIWNLRTNQKVATLSLENHSDLLLFEFKDAVSPHHHFWLAVDINGEIRTGKLKVTFLKAQAKLTPTLPLY